MASFVSFGRGLPRIPPKWRVLQVSSWWTLSLKIPSGMILPQLPSGMSPGQLRRLKGVSNDEVQSSARMLRCERAGFHDQLPGGVVFHL